MEVEHVCHDPENVKMTCGFSLHSIPTQLIGERIKDEDTSFYSSYDQEPECSAATVLNLPPLPQMLFLFFFFLSI